MTFTADEIARTLTLDIKFGERPLSANDMRGLIAAALTTYRDEALEEAAAIADTYCLNVSDSGDCYAALIARQIRALKDKLVYVKPTNDINHKDYDKNNVGG